LAQRDFTIPYGLTSPGEGNNGGPGALAASYNKQATATTAGGTAISSFDTSLFATNAANAFSFHVRTFSTMFPNLRQDVLNEWDPSALKLGLWVSVNDTATLRPVTVKCSDRHI
jgi:hypothetical protein